jgi:WD40 repeat protein
MMIATLVAFATVSTPAAGALTVTPIKTVPGARILALAPGSSGARFVASLENRVIRLYNAADRSTIKEFIGHPQPAYAVACSNDGKRIASGDESGRIFVWHVASGGKALEIRPHIRGVQALAFNAKGTQILSTGKDDTIKMIDVASGKVLKTWYGKGANYYGATWLPGGAGVAVGTLGQGALLMSGSNVRKLMGHQDNSVFEVDFSGGRAITAGRDATAMVWDVKGGKKLQTLRGHGDWIVHATFTPNGRFAVTASADRSVKVWDMKTFKCVSTISDQSAIGSPICVTPDGRYLVTSTIEDFLQVHFLSPPQGSSK